MTGKKRTLRRLLTLIVALAAATALGYLAKRALLPSPQQLLARAYVEQRTFELRMVRTPHSPFRVSRGQQSSSLDRSLSLLAAEAKIARRIVSQPDDVALLSARGQTGLLEWSYESAITDFQRALGSAPDSVELLNDLASAYFERAESENRFGDYATAFELQSRALKADPANTIILFNRAMTAARLCLYEVSTHDWQTYLRMESVGDWADEARTRLAEIREIVNAHKRQTDPPLLSPIEFTRLIDPSRPDTWGLVEPRIEEYLFVASSSWLPSAYTATAISRSSLETRRALGTLAIILERTHGDRWLSDLLSATSGLRFADAVSVLAKAIDEDNVIEDYVLGRQDAVRSAELFLQAGNQAGAMRAKMEEIYALHFADSPVECLRRERTLSSELAEHSYHWIEIQLALEMSVCQRTDGNLGRAAELSASAHKKAESIKYPSLSLRSLGFLAGDLSGEGRRIEAWLLCHKGLTKYWHNSTVPMPGYNLYVLMDHLAEESAPWHFQVAVDEQALALLPSKRYPLLSAFEHNRLARAAEMANLPDIARASFVEAQRLFNVAPQNDITANVRFGTEIELAEVAGERGESELALNQLRSMNSRLTGISNSYVVGDYFKAIAKLESAAGHPQLSEEALEDAVAMMEQQRQSLRSDDDRAMWSRESVGSYLALIDSKLRLHDIEGALATWEMYRNEFFGQKPLMSDRSSPRDLETETEQLKAALAIESSAISESGRVPNDSSVLVYVETSRAMAIWVIDKRGISERSVEKDPALVRMLVRQFTELCATPNSSLSAVKSSAQTLYRLLVAPVVDDLPIGQTLIIETDDELARVPFQALMDTSGNYLSDKHPIVYAPTFRYLAGTTSGERKPYTAMDALIVASASAGGGAESRSLPDVVGEAQIVAAHFPNRHILADADASLSAVVAELPHVSVFHFAGHSGVSNGRMGLLLASTESSGNSTLDSAALNGVSLSNLHLVVLSACSTENDADMEALAPQSLAYSFLRAGVPHVLVTRWNLDSASSKVLARTFYDSLLAGNSVSSSLVRAQALVRGIEPHPYYWAAFDAFGRP